MAQFFNANSYHCNLSHQMSRLSWYIFSSATLLSIAFLNIVYSCDDEESYNDQFIGRMDLNSSYYCDPRNGRNIRGLTCCLPEKPNEMFPIFYLYANGPGHFTRVLDWTNNDDGAVFSKREKVYFLLHGSGYSSKNSPFVRLAAGLLNRIGKVAVAVDYSKRKDPEDYYSTIADLRTVGRVIAFAIKNWNLQNIVTLVGFSTGGQVIGEAGRAAQEIYHYKLKECIGLDPSGQGFDAGSSSIRLTRDSCQLVQVIHTSSAYSSDGLERPLERYGTFWKSGHCDWWINCGHRQPECYTATLNENLVRNGFSPVGIEGENESVRARNPCSHFQSQQIYNTALARKCTFVGVPCECGGQHCVILDTHRKAPFLQCNPSMNTSFYVKTRSFPYC